MGLQALAALGLNPQTHVAYPGLFCDKVLAGQRDV